MRPCAIAPFDALDALHPNRGQGTIKLDRLVLHRKHGVKAMAIYPSSVT
uniref:Uncharacterized protein n=1 Tax=Anguilla anguilla TaxID=7936 RepID=A0A0E9VAV9_ANGAN